VPPSKGALFFGWQDALSHSRLLNLKNKKKKEKEKKKEGEGEGEGEGEARRS